MAKQGSIKHYRQTGAAKAPSGLPFGELAVAKDGTLLVGNANNAPVEAGVQVYAHAYNASTKVHNFTGSGGANGRAKITAEWKAGDTCAVNGVAVPAYIGGEAVDELPVGRWVTFVFDGAQLNFKSGGASLNFKVVGGTATPGNPRENTMWINTTVAITDYAFCAAQPTKRSDGKALSGGEVWICVGLDSAFTFSAIRKNALLVNPTHVSQFVGSVWVTKSCSVFQAGVWKPLVTQLFDNGNEFVNTTGGWSLYWPNEGGQYAKNTVLYTYKTGNGGPWGPNWYTAKEIDLAKYKTMKCRVVENSGFWYGTLGLFSSGTASPNGSPVHAIAQQYGHLQPGRILAWDISAIKTSHRIFVGTCTEGGSVISVDRVWLE